MLFFVKILPTLKLLAEIFFIFSDFFSLNFKYFSLILFSKSGIAMKFSSIDNKLEKEFGARNLKLKNQFNINSVVRFVYVLNYFPDPKNYYIHLSAFLVPLLTLILFQSTDVLSKTTFIEGFV